MYRYDDCLSDTCDFVSSFIAGVDPNIYVAYEGLYIVCVVKIFIDLLFMRVLYGV